MLVTSQLSIQTTNILQFFYVHLYPGSSITAIDTGLYYVNH